MPIYEFYCIDCHTIFNFFSTTINTSKIPTCPKCKTAKLSRQMSPFAVTGRARDPAGAEDLPFDEQKMERAMSMLAAEAEGMDENDPRRAADMVRKLTDMTGIELGHGMQEALARLEAGEDPDQIEAEMGDVLENEDPFVLGSLRSGAPAGGKSLRGAPRRDETLYDL